MASKGQRVGLLLLTILLSSHLVCGTHLRFGAIDWRIPDLNKPTEVHFHLYEAIRSTLFSYMYLNVGVDPEGQICPEQTQCRRFSLWNGRFQYNDGDSPTAAPDYYTFHYDGSTPRDLSATQTRTYSDGSSISAGLQNWYMTERVLIKNYAAAQQQLGSYSTCCRQYQGVRNVVNGEDFILKSVVMLQHVTGAGVRQNPHCSAFPIFAVRFDANNPPTSVLNLNQLCSTPHDSALEFSFTSLTDSGLRQNGDVWNTYTRPIINVATGLMTWTPSADGYYAVQFTATDDYGNTNVLDIVFDVNTNAAGSSPYFVEIRDSIDATYTATSTTAIFNPTAQVVSIGQSIQLSVWAHSPTGSLTGIQYVWPYTSRTTASHTCTGTTQFCDLQFSYTPALGDTSRNLCLQVTSTVGSYVGAPNDPSNSLTFCIPITVMERDYIYISGYIRDFRKANNEELTTGMWFDTSSAGGEISNFVTGNLGSSTLKPEYFNPGIDEAAFNLNATKFGYWFTDSQFSQRVTTSVTLGFISGTAGQPGSVYEASLNPWYPVNCAGWDSSINNCSPETNTNGLYTYEVNTYFTYTSTIPNLEFESNDFLWVFIDGKLVLADTRYSASPLTRTLNLHSLTHIAGGAGNSNTDFSPALTESNSYSLSIFFVHRSSTFNPMIRWQIPGGSICDAVSGANNTFSVATFGPATNPIPNVYDTQNGAGMIGITGSSLRLTTNSLLSSSALYYAEGNVAQKFHVRDGFETSFTFTISDCTGSDCTCASTPCKVAGFAFIIQDDSVTARGGAASALGYEGILSAVAIEFDGIQDLSESDPTWSHISYHRSSGAGQPISAVETTTGSNSYTDQTKTINMSPGQSHTIRIQYLPGQQLTSSSTRLGWMYVFVNGELTPSLEYAIDSSQFDMFSNDAYVGFTASTTGSDAVPILISNWAFKVVQPSATLSSFRTKSFSATAGVANSANIMLARDSCGNAVTTGGDASKVSATLTGTASLTATIIDTNDGNYTIQFTATIEGSYTLAVRFENQPINSGLNTVPIAVSPNTEVSVPNSNVNTFPTNVVVGSTSSATFILRDAYMNNIHVDLVTLSNPSVRVSVSPDPTTFSPPGTVTTAYDSISRVYSVNISSPYTNAAGFVIRIFVIASGTDVSSQTIQFVAGPLSLPNCGFDASSPPLTTLTSTENGTFYVIARDSSNNQIITDPTDYQLRYSMSEVSGDTLCSECVCAWAGNRFQCDYHRYKMGTYTVTAKLYTSGGSFVGNITDGTFTLTVTASTTSIRSIVTNGAAATVAGNDRTIYIEPRDIHDNTIVVQESSAGSWDINFTPAFTPKPSVQFSGGLYSFTYALTNLTTYPSGVAISITFQPTGGSATNVVSGSFTDTWSNAAVNDIAAATTPTVTVGGMTYVTLTLTDIYGNEVTDEQSSSISVRVQLPDTQQIIASIGYYNGVHNASFTTTQAGTHTITYQVGGVNKASDTVTVAPGAATTGQVYTQDSGWVQTQKDTTVSVRIQALDQYGNTVPESTPSDFKIFVNGINPSAACNQTVAHTSLSNGLYNFTFPMNCTYPESYSVSALFGGVQFLQTTLKVVQANAINGKSIVATSRPFAMRGGVEYSFVINAKTDGGVARSTDLDTFTFSITNNNTIVSGVTPTDPVFVMTTGTPSSTDVTVNFTLSYAGTYNLRIFDGLELEESAPPNNGYAIVVSAGPPAQFQVGSSDYASIVFANENLISSAQGSTIYNVVAGSVIKLWVYVKDAYLAPITDSTLTVSATVTGQSAVTGTLNVSQGYWEMNLTPTAAGTQTFSVSVSGSDGTIQVGPTYQMIVVAAAPDTGTSTLSVTNPSLRAGDTLSFVACFKDVYSNNAVPPSPRTRLSVEFAAANPSSGINQTTANPLTLSSALTVVGSSGSEHCLTVSAIQEQKADSFTMVVKLDGTQFGGTQNVTYQNSLAISPTLSTVSSLPSSIIAGNEIYFSMAVKDTYGNAYDFDTTAQNLFRVRVQSSTVLTLTKAQSTAFYQGSGGWALTLEGFCTHTASPTPSSVSGTASPTPAPPTNCLSLCRTCTTGTYYFEFFSGDTNIFTGQTPTTMNVTSQIPYNSTISYEYSPDAATATTLNAGDTESGISFQTYDMFGNSADQALGSYGTLAAVAYTGDPGCSSDDTSTDELLAPTNDIEVYPLTYSGSGKYQIMFKATTKNTYYLGVQYNGAIVCGSIQTITATAAVWAPNNTQITGVADVEVNQGATLTLSFRDKFGNPSTSTSVLVSVGGLSQFNLTLSGFTQNGAAWEKTIGAGLLTTTIVYKTTVTGSYPFTVTIDGHQVPDSLILESGTTTSKTSIQASFGAIADVTQTPFQTVRAGKFSTVTLIGVDTYGNNVTVNDWNATLSFSENTGTYRIDGVQVSAGMGKVTFRFIFFKSGTFTPTVNLFKSTDGGVTTTNILLGKPLATLTVNPSTCTAETGGARPYRCANGTCVADYFTGCAEAQASGACAANQIICPDGTCQSSSQSCGCPSGQEKCPTGECKATGTCISGESANSCPTNYHFCQGTGVCRASAADCPSPRVCSYGYQLCPDGFSCARIGASCQNFTRSSCSNYECPDGSCANNINDCPTPTTCQLSGYVVCPDGSCQPSVASCPELDECAGYLTNTFRCPDGTCVANSADCPSSVVCPPNYVKCEDGACAQNVTQCGPVANLTCSASQVKCPDGSCARNWLSCPTKKTCPPQLSVLCQDGACVATQSECSQTYLQTTCPSGSKRCPDGTCVDLSYRACPTGITCPETHPVLCNDGSCQSNSSYCKTTTPCGDKYRCPDGSCRNGISECPTYSACPSTTPVRCSDYSCKDTADKCNDGSLVLCQPHEVRCPSGSCANSSVLCPSTITCPGTHKRCIDGTCRQTCIEDNGEQPVDCTSMGFSLQCPQAGTGVSCRNSLADCPQGLVCPDDAPVKCIDSSCAASVNDCPSPPTTWSSAYIACPDGSYSTSQDFCGTPVTCLESAPYQCWDGTCRKNPIDCPDFISCPQATPFMCPNGVCRSSPWNCGPIVSCTSSNPVRCQIASECVSSASQCGDPYEQSRLSLPEVSVCPESIVRCRGGVVGAEIQGRDGQPYCAKSASCVTTTCPSFRPYLCSDGYCAQDPSFCTQTNGCPYSNPVKCYNGACVKNTGECPSVSNQDAITCDKGYKADALSLNQDNGAFVIDTAELNNLACNDGSCQGISMSDGSSDYSACPGYVGLTTSDKGEVSGCESGKQRCRDGTCASSTDCTKKDGGEGYCPANRPYQCPTGLCVLGSADCTAPPGPSCAEGIRCDSGHCVTSELDCPIIAPCFTKVRCADGTCRDDARDCPLNNPCPDGYKYRCPVSGRCAASSSDCDAGGSIGQSCPQGYDLCSNGACVVNTTSCSNFGISGTGCSVGLHKCWNGECVSSVYQCPASNGCPWNLPFRCGNGTCVADTSICPTDTCSGLTCVDGSCVQDYASCTTSQLCPVSTPYRCADGTCSSNGAYGKLLDNTFSETVCAATIVCPPGTVSCADGSCALSQDLCSAKIVCPDYGAVFHVCPNGICAINAQSCPGENRCPSGNIILCPDGSCVGSPSQCSSNANQNDCNLQCYDGRCVNYYSECLSIFTASSRPAPLSFGNEVAAADSQHQIALQSFVPPACPTGKYRCSDGFCVPYAQRDLLCPVVPRCPEATPFRCESGQCAASSAACTSISCPENTVPCTDGTCRPKGDCPRFDGCDVNQYMCWEEQQCVSNGNQCKNDTLSYSNTYLTNPRLEQIGVCTDNCNRDMRSRLVVATIPSGATATVPVIDDPVVGQAVRLSIPAGALNTTNSNSKFFYTITASDSQLRSADNFVRREFFQRLGPMIPYSRTVLSAPFYCWVSSNVGAITLNITITAKLDRNYPHSANDICLATLDQYGNWRCLYPTVKDRRVNPLSLSNGVATGSFDKCGTIGSAGKLYAFIYTPGDSESQYNDNVFSTLQRWWPVVALGCIFFALVVVFLVYYCYRKLRYRSKYKAEVQKNKDKQIELERMKEVGAAGGNVGGKEAAQMENNPLQITIDNVNNLQNMLPSDENRQKRFAREEEVKKKRQEYISTLEDENKKLLELVENLKGELGGGDEIGVI